MKEGKSKSKANIIKSIAEYDIQMDKSLGEGGFGQVFIAKDTKRKEKVAVKFIHKNSTHDNPYRLAALKNQVRLLRMSDSKNVVSYKDILVSKNFYYIVQQLCDYDLHAYLKKKGCLSQQETVQITAQILSGFYQLIVHGIVHRDLKPANILFKDGIIKIGDFGLAKKICEGSKLLESKVGSFYYQSPQVFIGKKYSYKCDIWGIGAIIYELLYGRILFKGDQKKIIENHKNIQNLVFPKEPVVSSEMKQLIKQCLKYNEQDRADWSYLFNHPLFKQKVPNINHLEQNLNYIICTIRNEVHHSNLNLNSLFDRFKKEGNSQIKQEGFCKIVLILVGEGKITLEDMKYAFRRFDINENGKISLQQFIDTLEKHGVERNGILKSDKKIQSKIYLKMKEQDEKREEQNESYSEKELLQMEKTDKIYQKIINSLLVEKFQNLKQKYDLQDLTDAGLQKNIFSSLLKEILPQITEEECDLLFRKFDDNKDGKISFDEFNKYICQVAGLPFRITQHALFKDLL